MVIIIDDVVSNFDTFRKNTLQIIGDENLSIDWCSFEYEHEFKDFCLKMIDIASKYYDLSSSIGYEFGRIIIQDHLVILKQMDGIMIKMNFYLMQMELMIIHYVQWYIIQSLKILKVDNCTWNVI